MVTGLGVCAQQGLHASLAVSQKQIVKGDNPGVHPGVQPVHLDADNGGQAQVDRAAGSDYDVSSSSIPITT